MGTATDWIHVLLSAVPFGLFIFLDATGKRDGKVALKSILAGIFFGVAVHFGLRSIRWPLLCVTVPSLLGTILISRHIRRTRQTARLDAAS